MSGLVGNPEDRFFFVAVLNIVCLKNDGKRIEFDIFRLYVLNNIISKIAGDLTTNNPTLLFKFYIHVMLNHCHRNDIIIIIHS